MAYLYYYAATSYEYLGRAAHIFSNTKISLLTSALENFEAAQAALPATLPQPIVDSHQKYSPLSTDPYSLSPSSKVDLSPLPRSGHIWSPTGSSTHEHASAPNPEAASPSFEIWSPACYTPVRGVSHHQDAGSFQTPPPPLALPAAFTPLSSYSAITTAFCVTPPLSAQKVSRPVFGARAAVFDTPSSMRAPPPPPHGSCSSPSVGDKLASFDSDEHGLPIGGNIVKNIARMIDSSSVLGAHDPFVSREPPTLRPGMRPPVRLSPIKFPADLEDPANQMKLFPSPLQIRKATGEVIKCARPGVVVRGSSTSKDAMIELKRPIRVRPPRIPLKIIPSNNQITDKGQTKSPILVPRLKRMNPVLPMAIPEPDPPSPSISMPPVTPTPALKKSIPILGSPFTNRLCPPDTNSMSPYSPPQSPSETATPNRATEIIKFNKAVIWLREHIPEDLTDLRQQIQHVTDLQNARRTRNMKMSRSASVWKFTPVKSQPDAETDDDSLLSEGTNIDENGNLLRVEVKAQRIERLRKEGWKIGIRSKHSLWKGTEHYDKLTETALAEVGESRGLTVEGHAHLRKW